MINTTQVKRFNYRRKTIGDAVDALNSYSQQPQYIFGYIEQKKTDFNIIVIMKGYGTNIKRQHRAIIFTKEIEA